MVRCVGPLDKMTDRDKPLLVVVVTGPPASGKTTVARTLARELALPLFAKDDVKKALFESLGTGDRAWSRRLGAASFRLLFVAAAAELRAGRSTLPDGNFTRGEAEPDFASRPPHRLVQVYCCAPEKVLVERFRARRRHPGHLDDSLLEDVLAAIRAGRHRPLELRGRVVDVDTTSQVSPSAVVGAV